MFYTEKEQEEKWKRDQIKFAEVAHQYPCCMIPTLEMCFRCTADPDNCKNKTELNRVLDRCKPLINDVPNKSAASDGESVAVPGKGVFYIDCQDSTNIILKRRA